MSDLYEYLNAKKGKAYFDDQIKPFSLISIYPGIDTSRKLRGNSRTTGDADKEIQDTIIDMIITIAVRYSLSYKEISYILLTTKVESGFNPDAAAGTTSAAGLAQGTVGFIKDALTQSEDILGFQLDLRNQKIFDAENGCYAVIYSFLLNKSKVMESYTSDQSEYWEWLYLLHHDGAYSLGKYLDGTRKKSSDGKKWALYITERLSVVEGLLKNTEVKTKFQLSTGDNTAFKNKNYIAAISPFPGSTCPSLVSDYEKSLVFIKGITDANGMTESVNATAGSEVIFTILSDNYKQLAKTPSVKESSEQQETIVYTVKKGDTLSAIAKKHAISIEKLARINKIHNVNMLSVGAKLKIPDNNQNHGYISRYVSEQTKKEVLKSVGIESPNYKAAIEYARSHIVLPRGSTSADINKDKNIIHIKTTTKSDAIKVRKQPLSKHKTDKASTTKSVVVTGDFEPVIKWDASAIQDVVSAKTIEILKGIMKKSGVHKIYITSTIRELDSQVKAMWKAIEHPHTPGKGVEEQLKTYGPVGDKVIRAYAEASKIKPNDSGYAHDCMLAKAKELKANGELISRHNVTLEEYKKINTLDISYTRMGKGMNNFINAVLEHKKNTGDIKNFFYPGNSRGEHALHLEIIQ
ncbi:LysM peptidoglycan-binding domain-containing protein [Scandinavium goeteborgense]|uniref:LysM peptidoglycan-binding domain-containing protein n=1 Tax=Scandinavium goeteborgense TaxID=1851514 RepID=UPI00157363EB|nr:LysM peptidoglycan-binding domain-containing protein [Scandinavium goeteborgense]QKN79816.1 LysM peptidoglycan-binding domain-containing protein [Scandinavium goeteborgense]